MAMTLRIDPELDARLDEAARLRHLSKHAYIVTVLERALSQEEKTARVLASLDATSRDYAGLIKRLEDA